MPDRDIVHMGLNAIWQKSYKEICEGFFPADVCAYDAIEQLVKTIKRYGNEPIKLLEQVAVRLKEISTGPLILSTIDWSAESLKIERVARGLGGNKRGISLALKICKEGLDEIRRDGSSTRSLAELAGRYFRLVYEADFESRVGSPKHYHDADPQFVEQRLSEMRPLVTDSIGSLAKRIARMRKVEKLRVPSRRSVGMPIDLNMDLSLKVT